MHGAGDVTCKVSSGYDIQDNTGYFVVDSDNFDQLLHTIGRPAAASHTADVAAPHRDVYDNKTATHAFQVNWPLGAPREGYSMPISGNTYNNEAKDFSLQVNSDVYDKDLFGRMLSVCLETRLASLELEYRYKSEARCSTTY